MIGDNIEELYKRLSKANHLMTQVRNREDRMALANYIGNLYTTIGNVLNIKVKPKKKQIFGSKDGYKKFYRVYDSKENEMLDNLIKYKEFHSELFCDILFDVKEIMKSICDEEIIEENIISEDSFYEIFMGFMNSIGLEELFIKFLKEGRIQRNLQMI